MATITVKGTNALSTRQRLNALQFMQENLSDDELSKLHQLAKSDKSRRALKEKWNIISSMFM